jgi:hypothetical protein
MYANLRSIFIAPITLAGLLALAGCDAEPAAVDSQAASVRVDLTHFGVHAVVSDGDGHELRDADGNAVGRIAIHGASAEAELDIVLHDHTVEVDWDASAAAMRCDGGAPLTVRAGSDGWTTPVQEAGDDLNACDDALLVGFEVARAAGVDPPWAAELETDVAFRSACMTVSTWVAGSSCWSCAQAAAHGRCAGCDETSGDCSSGTLYTSCTHTYCQVLLNE